MAIMTPLDFANQYLSLPTYLYDPEPDAAPPFPLSAGWKSLKVARYRLGATPWDRTLWQDISTRLGQSVTIRVKTILGVTEDVTLLPVQLWKHFHYPFVGKGSPEQAQIAIQLTYRFHKTHSAPEQFVKQDFIGLDCNGFVGNYLQRVVKGLAWQQANNDADPGPTTLIGDLLQAQGVGNQMTDIKDLKSEDTYILGHCTPDGTVLDPSKAHPTSWGHVMITQPGTLTPLPKGFTMGVVEATAAANRELRYLPYTFLSSQKQANGTVFKIWRGLTSADAMDVRIARLKI